MKSLSRVRLLATPWTAAHQAPPSMGFSRQEYWSGVPLPSPLFPQDSSKTRTAAWAFSSEPWWSHLRGLDGPEAGRWALLLFTDLRLLLPLTQVHTTFSRQRPLTTGSKEADLPPLTVRNALTPSHKQQLTLSSSFGLGQACTHTHTRAYTSLKLLREQ